MIYFKEGKCFQTFQHQRIREYPPSGGMSTCAVSVVSDGVREAGLKILQALNWTGVAMVEFKVTEQGVPYLLEINPKFWGSHDLALASGVNFPTQVVDLIDGKELTYSENYKLGVKFHWPLHGDIQHGFLRPRSALSVLLDLLNPRVKSNLWVFTDIAGTLGMIPNLLRKLKQRLFA